MQNVMMRGNERVFLYFSPIGKLGISVDEKGLRKIEFLGENDVTESCEEENVLAIEVKKQLDEYFQGKRKKFNLSLAPYGTPFQLKVWSALQNIPYGETRSYKDIAVQVDNAKGCRAVGMANNKNPIPIIIPCHRVVGANGKLVGYAGGLDKKIFLLELEQRDEK